MNYYLLFKSLLLLFHNPQKRQGILPLDLCHPVRMGQSGGLYRPELHPDHGSHFRGWILRDLIPNGSKGRTP